MNRLLEFIDEHNAWCNKTFGKRSPKSPLNHLIEEAKELANDPTDIMEFADCFMTFINGLHLAGFHVSDLERACWEKLEINKGRTWEKIGEGDSAYFKHVKEKNKFDSAVYWEQRYAGGGSSGDGSRGLLQQHKALLVNDFILDHPIATIIDWGCGDGRQLQALLKHDPGFWHYTGIDVSKTAIELCKTLPFNLKYFTFITADEYKGERADLALSMDVIYHLVEDGVFEAYMKQLCDSADKYIIIYSSDGGKVKSPAIHLKERCFTKWIEENRPEWKLIHKHENMYPYQGGITKVESISDWYYYQRETPEPNHPKTDN